MKNTTDTLEYVEVLRKMGHDMRVPLNTLISTSDMLTDGVYDALTPKQAKAAVRLQRNSRRLLAILDDFMTYVKADVGDLVVSPKSFDPRTQLEAWCNPIRTVIEEKGLILNLTISEVVPTTLIGDEPLLKRIVQALLWNAAAYTSEGEINVTSDWPSKREWLISVKDSGVGISDDNLPHIFEPFWRGEERPQYPTAGAGLGLPMSLALATLMGGTLLLIETSAHGSQFCVQLPMEEVSGVTLQQI
jgi:two-component system sensor histidine kinase/response regulator